MRGLMQFFPPGRLVIAIEMPKHHNIPALHPSSCFIYFRLWLQWRSYRLPFLTYKTAPINQHQTFGLLLVTNGFDSGEIMLSVCTRFDDAEFLGDLKAFE
ncbi:hypothetical protein JTE90_010369 [Oedothorax gibbosus]|uniref:Uncharacterized protein n=1 Tax=Oedothorax gibbosus TaxID=931172 RepID=A0AAV6VZF8_9ARAC|nr:hypothetical protein JTE90_010369 [Oedothorax gibbosus]